MKYRKCIGLVQSAGQCMLGRGRGTEIRWMLFRLRTRFSMVRRVMRAGGEGGLCASGTRVPKPTWSMTTLP